MNAKTIIGIDSLQPQYLHDKDGNKTLVVFPIEVIQALLDKMAEMAESLSDDWDKQITTDAKAGKLDKLLNSAKKEYKESRTQAI
jgi:hypothetical protein